MITGIYALLPDPRHYRYVVKIGYATDIERRVKWHRWRWKDLEVVAYWYTLHNNPVMIETLVHQWVIDSGQGFRVDICGSNETFRLHNVYDFMVEFNNLDLYKLLELTSNAHG